MYYQIPGTNVRLLGSLHMVPVGEQPVPAWAREAYAWSEALVVEHDPPTLLPFFKTSTPLQSKIAASTYSELEALWPETGPLSPLSQLRPWAALLGLAMLSHSAIEGIEPNFLAWAKNDRRTIRYLEVASEVAASFDTVDVGEVEAGLRFVLSNRSIVQKRLLELHAAWLKQDPSQVFEVAATAPLYSQPGIRVAVLERRNRAWVPVVESLLASQRRTLIVVGALHLSGPNNLSALLGRSMVSVQRVG